MSLSRPSGLPPVGSFEAPVAEWTFCDLCRCLVKPADAAQRNGRPGVTMCFPCAETDVDEALATIEQMPRVEYRPGADG